jgi:hypothetical protein
VKTVLGHDFLSMAGPTTRAAQFRDVLIEDLVVLADPIDDYLNRIRPSCVPMRSGMALGMVRSSIRLLEQVRGQLGHVAAYLKEQPEDFQAVLDWLQAEGMDLAVTPVDTSLAFLGGGPTARLQGGEAVRRRITQCPIAARGLRPLGRGPAAAARERLHRRVHSRHLTAPSPDRATAGSRPRRTAPPDRHAAPDRHTAKEGT